MEEQEKNWPPDENRPDASAPEPGPESAHGPSPGPSPQFTPPPPSPPRRPGIAGPLLLIAIGVLLLLYNLGLIEWSVWEVLWRFWPVWLIAVGLDMLLGRRGAWGAILAIGILVTIIAGAVHFVGVWRSPRAVEEWIVPEAALADPTAIAQPLDSAAEARIEIKTGVSRFWLRGGAGPGMLIDGSIVPLVHEQIYQHHELDGDTASFSLRSDYEGSLDFPRAVRGGRWDLAITDEIPVALSLTTSIGESDIDLTGVKLTDLRLESGIGETTITLPGSGRFKARIRCGIGETTVRIPASLAARIRVETGIGQASVRGDYLRENGYYVSENWDTAEDRVELTVDGGVGRVRIVSIP